MTTDNKALRAAFGMFATGVTVVTTLDQQGGPVGFTANSFTSVSLSPPLLLICMSQKSRSFAAMTAATGFSISILAKEQKSISDTFSQSNTARFDNDYWHTGPAGYPLIKECAAWFECTQQQMLTAGDHIILLGKITGFAQSENPPLILSQSKFLP